VLERHIGRTEGPLAVMDMEHATFRGLLQDLAAGLRSENPAQCRQRAHAIIDLLRDHIAKEDHVLFPMASRLLSAEERAEVDARAAAIHPPASMA
jgi:hemerythrin-like domain-containing protein